MNTSKIIKNTKDFVKNHKAEIFQISVMAAVVVAPQFIDGASALANSADAIEIEPLKSPFQKFLHFVSGPLAGICCVGGGVGTVVSYMNNQQQAVMPKALGVTGGGVCLSQLDNVFASLGIMASSITFF